MNFVSDSIGKVDREWLITRWLFFRLLGLVYLAAFASYAVQIIGLNGAHGVLPTRDLLSIVTDHMGGTRYLLFPTLAWFSSSDGSLTLIAVVGVVLSVLITLGLVTGPSLILSMICWLSIVTGGGEFTEFQSDGMLLEASFLALFVVPWSLVEAPWTVRQLGLWAKRQAPPWQFGIWLLRFFIFRFIFAAGAVKLLSGNPTWANLTALQYHFETQPFPTPIAWYISQLPEWILKGMVLVMFTSELVAPLLMFGTRWMRYIAALLVSGLQTGILLTGNYTFLNYLTILLCLPLLDDNLVKRILPPSLIAKIEACTSESGVRASGIEIGMSETGVPAAGTEFGKSETGVPAAGTEIGKSETEVPASGTEIDKGETEVSAHGTETSKSETGVPSLGPEVGLGGTRVHTNGPDLSAHEATACALAPEVRTTQSAALIDERAMIWLRAVTASSLLLLAGSQFFCTFVPSTIPRPLKVALVYLSQYHIVDRYGLFAVMTTTRPEIVFEGSADGNTWLPYEIRYQISDLKKPPPWVAPHMPRLSWRLWFAAMNQAEASPWVLGLVERMLQNSPPVMEFFQTNPFAQTPPKYIRAWVYDYHFTRFDEKKKTGNWWRRDNQREYLPPFQLENGALKQATVQ